MFGKNKEIYKYVVNARGISRPVLNIVAFIGFFIHNWIIGVVFYCLGRVKLGLAYSLSIACLYFTIALTDSTWENNFSVFLLILYIISWIHANVILSRYQSIARQRIAEIDGQVNCDINALLEKAVLLHRILRRGPQAVEILLDALHLPGGDPLLLYCAGVTLRENQFHRKASEFYDRALQSAEDESLMRKIEHDRVLNERRVNLDLLIFKVHSMNKDTEEE